MSQQAAEVTAEAVMDPPPPAAGDSAPAPAPAPVPVPDEAKVHLQLLYPPHNGFGGDEDSLGSCLQLRPKPPRKDLVP